MQGLYYINILSFWKVNLKKKGFIMNTVFFNQAFKDISGNIFVNVSISGNQLGNRIGFICKVSDAQYKQGFITGDEVIALQVACSTSPYNTSLKSFKKSILNSGGSIINHYNIEQ